MTIDPRIRMQLAPTGRLRAAINLGNPILAGIDAGGRPAGVSVDLARRLAQQLDVDVELVVVDAAGKSVEAVVDDRADVGFFAIDPVRGAGIAFTAPYVLIEGCYLVRAE
jgi:polar amino acid transport system substrate-binding protein